MVVLPALPPPPHHHPHPPSLPSLLEPMWTRCLQHPHGSQGYPHSHSPSGTMLQLYECVSVRGNRWCVSECDRMCVCVCVLYWLFREEGKRCKWIHTEAHLSVSGGFDFPSPMCAHGVCVCVVYIPPPGQEFPDEKVFGRWDPLENRIHPVPESHIV